MLRSILIGIVAGARSMTPLAIVTNAARRNALPEDDAAVRLLASPLVSGGALALAAGELAGDKMKSAPDRIVALGIAARLVTAAVAGAALAPRRNRPAGALLAAAAATGAAYLTFNLRMKAMERYGQTSTGLVEDAIAVASAIAVVNMREPAAA